jgi:hypothetical protein
MVATVGRVRGLTAEDLNRKFQTQAKASAAYYANHPDAIERRLAELDNEWDIERAIETEAAATVLTGVLLGATVDRKWFLLPVFASAMLLLHNLHGAYPLLPLLRRLGLRTSQEIAQERYALKAIRGDFGGMNRSRSSEQTVAAFRAADPDDGHDLSPEAQI